MLWKQVAANVKFDTVTGISMRAGPMRSGPMRSGP